MRILFDWNGENSDRLVSARHKCACLLENKGSMSMHCFQTWDTVDWEQDRMIDKIIFKILRNKKKHFQNSQE